MALECWILQNTKCNAPLKLAIERVSIGSSFLLCVNSICGHPKRNLSVIYIRIGDAKERQRNIETAQPSNWLNVLDIQGLQWSFVVERMMWDIHYRCFGLVQLSPKYIGRRTTIDCGVSRALSSKRRWTLFWWSLPDQLMIGMAAGEVKRSNGQILVIFSKWIECV